ncbi:MAG: right-handed parallel beta-helix repeat-containing protein, partial [Ignavibacteria bacterium]
MFKLKSKGAGMKAGKQAIIVFLILFLNGLVAQQTWHGKLSGDTKWSGEIILDGDIIVPKGISLNIEPGTKIYVLPGTDVTKSGKDKNRTEILVFGSFIANGEPNNRILFTSRNDNPQMNDWYGIILRNKSGTNLINYVTVEYAYVGLTTINCKAIIKNSQFRYNYYTGISAELRSKPIIQNCVLSNNDYAGLKCEYGAMPVVRFSIISGNSHGVIIFNEAEPILGKIEANGEVSGGYNRIFDNFDYNIYNHTYKTIYAQVNNWLTSSTAEIMKTIYDRSKD